MIPKIILDFETSGLNPYHDDIIEVGFKVMDSGESHSALLKPKSNECISDNITRLTGITNRMLAKEGKDWKEVYQFINDFLISFKAENGKIAIISHNGEVFDFIFLRRILNDLKQMNIKTFPIDNIIFIDTLLLSKRLCSGRSSYRQSSLCLQYNINVKDSHRALNDVLVLEQLYIVLTKKLNDKYQKRRCFLQYPQMVDDYIKYKSI